MKPRTVLAGLLSVPLVAMLQVAMSGAAHGSTSSCVPKADAPFISAGSGYARVHTEGCSSDTYTYSVSFTTTSGQVLSGPIQFDNVHGNITATAPLFNTLVGCAGKTVRSFIWININGTVKSNQTSGTSC
jgi:hypothetical protein